MRLQSKNSEFSTFVHTEKISIFFHNYIMKDNNDHYIKKMNYSSQFILIAYPSKKQ